MTSKHRRQLRMIFKYVKQQHVMPTLTTHKIVSMPLMCLLPIGVVPIQVTIALSYPCLINTQLSGNYTSVETTRGTSRTFRYILFARIKCSISHILISLSINNC